MDKIEPCDICGTKYTKEMCKIANKYLGDNDPCFCKSIKKIQKLIEEINMLNLHLLEAQPEDWDLEGIYDDVLEGRNEYTGEQCEPNIPYAKWLKKRYNLGGQNTA